MVGDSRNIVQKTLAGKIEMGVVGARFSERHLYETALTSDTLKLIVPPDHRWSDNVSIEIDALRQEPMIVRETGSGTLQALNNALKAKDLRLHDQFHIVAEIGNTAGVIAGIKSGLGVSILSTRAIADDLEHQTLAALDIKGIHLQRQFYLVSDQRRTLSPLARAFKKYVLEHLRDKA